MNHYIFSMQEHFTQSRVLHLITVPLANTTVLYIAFYVLLLVRLCSNCFSLFVLTSKIHRGIQPSKFAFTADNAHYPECYSSLFRYQGKSLKDTFGISIPQRLLKKGDMVLILKS